jgi:type I restriction enzyme, R subunit
MAPSAVSPRGGTSAPSKGPLSEVIEPVNQLFAANGADVGPSSVRGFITAYWEYLNENAEAAAMAKNNSVDQLKASDKFRAASENAVFKACHDATEIQSFMAASELHDRHREPLG